MKRRLKAFISYSHIDMDYKLSLLSHFESINKLFDIEFWHDGLIDAGGHIDDEVLTELNSSDIIILLISNAYISSNFCYNIEMKKAFEREKEKECIIVPILLKKTSLNDAMPFYNLKTIPTDRKPISSFRSKNDGYVDVTENLTSLIRNFFKDEDRNESVSKTPPKINSSNITAKNIPYINVAQDGKISPYQLNQELIVLITKSNKHMAEISSRFNELVIDHYLKYLEQYNSKNGKITPKRKRTMLQLFLSDLFIEIKTWFFNYGGIRIHARGLIQNKYNCIVALTDEKNNKIVNIDWTKELKEMSLNSMISVSSLLGVPMVKSLNRKQHEKGNHDNIWVDYLTCSFNNVYHSPLPLLSFGISIHKSSIKYYKDLLLVLAYLRVDLRIENAIKHYIKLCCSVDNTYDIKNIVESFN